MGKVQVLDENTINQIAAGEVIDRPASIVKELIENAIDAQASAITIEIKEGGSSLIRITDNGAGIEKDDIRTAFLRHATSKIRTAQDLLTVASLGFRGEALSSIAAVSMVELITKTKDSLMGCRYEINGGKEECLEEVGVPDGTTFIIRNLFYNTPARKKFMKTAMTEAGYISDIVQRIALSHPEISIRFINNGKHMINTSGNGKLKDVIYHIYGRDIAANLLEVNYTDASLGFSMKGYIGKPVISRGNRNYENYFINGRYIKSGMISKAIEEGYGNFMMQHKYPFTAIQFTVEPELIDVNVHPAKMELRFRNGDLLYPSIMDEIAGTLKGKEFINEVKMEKEEKQKPQIMDKTPEIFESRRIEAESRRKEQVVPVLRETPVYHVKDEVLEVKTEPIVIPDTKIEPQNKPENKTENKPEQLTLFDDKLLSKESRVHHKIVGQVFDTYWIVEYDEKMFIIDQHAAHEKVLYERTMAKLAQKECLSQTLNPPIILSLSIRETEMLQKYQKDFEMLGYEISEFGGNDYAVHGVPYDLYALAKEDLLMELIDGLSEDGMMRGESKLIIDKIASMSCKAAVKGNNRLSIAEANALIDELMTLENPYNCPHGRPTIISMSKYELEKKFKRII